MAMKGIFDLTASNVGDRVIRNYGDLVKVVATLREMGYTIALTSGTWDMLHIGHNRYLEAAKKRADVLIVGVDSDEKVRSRKKNKGGMPRPINGEKERVEMLAFQRAVDVIFLKDINDGPQQLLKTVHPDVLILSETTGHEEGSIEEMKKWAGDVIVLEPQAPPGDVSTTAKIRMLFISGQEKLLADLAPEIDSVLKISVSNIASTLTEQLGGAISTALKKVVARRENGEG